MAGPNATVPASRKVSADANASPNASPKASPNASPDAAARAAKEFQTLFLMEMLRPLTEALSRSSLLGGEGAAAGQDIYGWFWNEALAGHLAQGWPLPSFPPGPSGASIGATEARGAPDAPGAPGAGFGLRVTGAVAPPSSPDAARAAADLRGSGAPASATAPPAIPGAGKTGSLTASLAAALDAGGATDPAAARADGSEETLVDRLVARASRLFEVPANLVRAVVSVESSGRSDAVSTKGAVGLMQLMPGTAREMGVRDPSDPWENLYGGVKYLSRQLERFGSVEIALAAYNAGPGAVDRHGGVPPYPETRDYVRKVLEAKSDLDRLRPQDA